MYIFIKISLGFLGFISLTIFFLTLIFTVKFMFFTDPLIGKEIFTEELTDFVGKYTKVIDMNKQPKGVYFLEITTSTGSINKKIVLQ